MHPAHMISLSHPRYPSLQVSELEDSLREQAKKLRQSDKQLKKLQQELSVQRHEASETAGQLRQSEAHLFQARSKSSALSWEEMRFHPRFANSR